MKTYFLLLLRVLKKALALSLEKASFISGTANTPASPEISILSNSGYLILSIINPRHTLKPDI